MSLFFSVDVSFSQEYKEIDDAEYVCDYDYLLQQDSTDIASVVLTEMRLLIGKHRISSFQTKRKFYTDSLIQKGADFSTIWSFASRMGGDG